MRILKSFRNRKGSDEEMELGKLTLAIVIMAIVLTLFVRFVTELLVPARDIAVDFTNKNTQQQNESILNK